MDTLPILLSFAFALVMTGVIWTVQLAIYPLFRDIPPPAFVAYHQRYTFWISCIVVPVMVMEAVCALWLLIRITTYSGYGAIIGAATALLVVNLLSTFFILVPQHNRLHEGFDRPTHRMLVRANWIRTAGWTSRSILLGVLLYALN
ncbi:MAG: hypothetical protein SFY80_11320 [Verrucomicrobiota bacterium]|nr:hypothetical protein [Verrucomicrobiota bacterium]